MALLFTQIRDEFGRNDAAVAIAAGLVALVWTSARNAALPRLVLAWWLIPYAIMSLGSSKLMHYAYPFIEPLAFGAGLAAAPAIRPVYDLAARADWRRFTRRAAARPGVHCFLIVAAVVGFAFWAWVYVTGQPVRVFVGDTMVFRNGSVSRPFVIAVIALVAAGYGRQACVATASMLIVLLLPTSAYARTIRHASIYDRPRREATNCMLDLQRRGERPAGVYISDWHMVAHPPYYYFRHVGAWAYGPYG